jgi:nucleoside-diphosphate-sugar epimerase
MTETIFLAGAAGVIGRRLTPQLVAAGWRVVGTTRSREKAATIAAAGAAPVVVDVFDAPALAAAVTQARPGIVIHQLTDLPRGLPPSEIDAARARNALIRDVGTRNLIAAAVAAGARRLVAQSIAFAYAPGPRPYREGAALNVGAPGAAGVTARGVASLEQQVTAAPLHGIVLRYGRLYGPGTGVDTPPADGPLHVEAAARAALLACTRGAPGIYNIAEEDGWCDVSRARSEGLLLDLP